MSRIITFYSYKGGTGRSMSLANVAWVFASNGKRVLVIDWDLEAPGLHHYFSPFLSDSELTSDESHGVIDFVFDFAKRAATPMSEGETRSEDWFDQYADISRWSQKVRWPSQARLGTERLWGSIDFVPAGRQGSEYAKKVNSFDWGTFYRQFKGEAFFEAVKKKTARYDYVLIDSRTGVSDTAGICRIANAGSAIDQHVVIPCGFFLYRFEKSLAFELPVKLTPVERIHLLNSDPCLPAGTKSIEPHKRSAPNRALKPTSLSDSTWRYRHTNRTNLRNEFPLPT